jgi:transcriptional regulator with XRE-family HTH domain
LVVNDKEIVMNFVPERLISVRKSLGINKAEAARRLNVSAMCYGRYEKGEREPSYQVVSYIAQIFNTSTDYLYGISDDTSAESITVSAKDEPDLFLLVESARHDEALLNRLIAYAGKLQGKCE